VFFFSNEEKNKTYIFKMNFLW